MITSWMGVVYSFGLRNSVAPNSRATSNLAGLISMAMIWDALAILAPIIAAKPMPPNPKIATVAPSVTFAVLSTAPIPVVTPHPSRQTFSSGASLGILAREISGSTVYSEKVEQPM
ncbi:hypothetical protein D9M71_568910 [compost metagenome]